MKYLQASQIFFSTLLFIAVTVLTSGNCHHTLVASDPCNTDTPTITITFPHGGETFAVGQTITITWTSCNVKDVFINLGVGGHDRGMLTQHAIPGASDSFHYTIPPAWESMHTGYWIGISQKEAPYLLVKSGEFGIQ